MKGGKDSPLAAYEPCFVEMTISLSRCRHPIASSEGLVLINSLMSGTELEAKLKDFKSHDACVVDKITLMVRLVLVIGMDL